jgi:protoporphyrinogen IX oxidase
MNGIDIGLVFVHVTANVVWIGAILAVAYTLTLRVGEPADRGKIAHALYLKLATPAFIVSFAAGAARLAMTPRYYFAETHWMHAKLLFAFGVIALHHMIGAHAKRMATGRRQEPGRVSALAWALLLCAALAVFFVVARPF